MTMMSMPPTVCEDEPTTALTPEEIALLTDEELVDYCEVHCWTRQARFHHSAVQRLFRLTGSTVRGEGLPEWITVRPAIVNALVQAARNGAAIT